MAFFWRHRKTQKKLLSVALSGQR